jgi:2-keto-4-pentenoate hydratase
MMSDHYDPMPAASMLAEAWKSGTQLAELPSALRPQTLSQGYDVQDKLIAALGEKVVGWKVAMGSPSALRKAGLERPLAGRVLASRCFRAGDSVPVPSRTPAVLEFEAGFILARDVDPTAAPVSPAEIIATACVTFELVGSRFVDRRACGMPSFVADNSGFHALVVGGNFDLAQLGELIRSATVSVDGEEKARALSGDELIEPIQTLGYLIAHARDRKIMLRRGDVVSAGTLTKPFELPIGSVEVVARFLSSELRMRTQVAAATYATGSAE